MLNWIAVRAGFRLIALLTRHGIFRGTQTWRGRMAERVYWATLGSRGGS
jgi:hypothetical protein